MSKVFVTESNLRNIANAIRRKRQINDTFLPSEMADAIMQIDAGDIINVQGESAYFDGETLVLDCPATIVVD